MIVDRTHILKMLVSGGDDRLALDPVSGLNMYGYGPEPVPTDLSFSSSTASSISPRGFDAACELYAKLQPEVTTGDATAGYAREMEVLRDRLRKAFGLDPREAIVFAASGTDLHLIVASLLRGLHARPILTLALTGSETGSGVALASGGRHPMPHPVSGRIVTKGEKLCADGDLDTQSVLIRDLDGELRPETIVADELAAAIESAVSTGRHVLLIATDVSKTGLIAPDLATVFALKSRFGDRVDVLVDACQLRLSPETLRAYLASGCLVAITGSKFIGGPIFSGALFVPQAMAGDLKQVSLGAGLGDYSGAGDWPAGWRAAKSLPARRNFGLLLRWQAAIVELEAFVARHPLKISWVTMRFAEVVQARLKADPRFEPVATRPLDRSTLGLSPNSDLVPTIFPFLLRRGDMALSGEETSAIYRDLAIAAPGRRPVRLGQPVALGQRCGQPIAALRLCLSAPLVTAASANQAALARLIAEATEALDRAGERAEQPLGRVA